MDFQSKQVPESLALVLNALFDGIRQISDGLVHVSTGKAGTTNSFGEEQIAMDVASEKFLESNLAACPVVYQVGSEELDGPKLLNENGSFTVLYDPLDGSSLFDANFAVGTIVGIFEGREIIGRTCREQVAALYAVYGPKTLIVAALPAGVFMWELQDGQWVGGDKAIVLKNDKKYFAPGNLRAVAERADYFELVNAFMKEKYTLRYSGGMVPDLHHILIKGSGVFMYPGMPSAPDGKLRLLYECGPMAFIMEKAGGSASTGQLPILDLPIDSYTQRCPILIGSTQDVERASQSLKPLAA